MNESLDDLLDALKQEADIQSSLQTKTPQSNMGVSRPSSVSTPPPPPKPARSKSQPQPQQQPLRCSNSFEKAPPCRLAIKLEEMSSQIDGVEESIMRGVTCELDSSKIEKRLKEMRVS